VTHRLENWTHSAEKLTHRAKNWTHSAEKLTHQAKNWTHWPFMVDTSPSSRRSRRPGPELAEPCPELAEGEEISTSFRARFPANARRRRPDTSYAQVNTLPSKVNTSGRKLNTFGKKVNTSAPNLNTLTSQGEHIAAAPTTRVPPSGRPSLPGASPCRDPSRAIREGPSSLQRKTARSHSQPAP